MGFVVELWETASESDAFDTESVFKRATRDQQP